MADASNCNLASYGYDFVVSTTQASINTEMKTYLSNAPLTFIYYCFLADPETDDPTVPIALEDLISQTGGTNPFDIPDGTPHTDPKVQALTNSRFAVGIKICVGMPQDIPPKELPEIVELGDSIDRVTFRIFCTQSVVIQNTGTGNWNVWSQPANQLWAFKTSVKLVPATVDNQLNSDNVNMSLSQKQQVLNQLQNISYTDFSIQQLFLDVENADVLSAPTIQGMPTGPAQYVLSGQVAAFWPMFAKQCTYPALAIIALPQSTFGSSSIQLSSFQQVVNPFKSSNGGQVLTPTKAEARVVTLDYLCMTNDKHPPTAEAFTWNWLQPSDIDSECGVLAINQRVWTSLWAQSLLDAIVGQAVALCVLADPVVGDQVEDEFGNYWCSFMTLTPRQTPSTVSLLPDGDTLFVIEYTAAGNPSTKSTHGSICNSTKCELDVVPTYKCTVSVVSSQLVITQQVQVQVTLDVVGVEGHAAELNETCMVIDTTRADYYQVSADQSCCLQTTFTKTESTDNSSSFGADITRWAHADDLAAVVIAYFHPYEPTQFSFSSTTLLDQLQSFQSLIFPIGKVFALGSASFSKSGDLLYALTYQDPEEAIPQTLPQTQVSEMINPIQLPKEDPAPVAAPTVTMTQTSDMIQNYVSGEIFSATSKFEVIQTEDGHSILFGLSGSNVLQAIVEQSGANSTGWQQIDITSTAVASMFANDPNAVIKTFDSNQSAVDNTISLGAVVTSSGSDNLLLSLGNPNSADSWVTTTATTTTSMTWKHIPFDAASDGGTPLTNITIVNVMFAEATSDGIQYTIVDIDRSSTSTTKDIARYYVNPDAKEHCWKLYDVPVDIEDGNYQSCVGRFLVDSYGTDAVFTSGMSGGLAQLVYVPLSNAFGYGPPPIRTLSLPGGAQATAIATSRASDGSTDFFAIGGSTLYMFPANSAPSDSVATTLISSDFFTGTDQMTAMTHGGVTTIWGRNTSKQIYYVSCQNGQFTTPVSWSTPLPLVTGIDKISAFTNRNGGSNTIFAAGGETLRRLVQATETGAKLWRQEALVLQPQQTTVKPKALSFNSYTTTLQVTDEQNLPAGGISISVSTASRAPVYINGVYYVLSPAPTAVLTDQTGVVTIVESAHKSINGTTLTVTCCSQTTIIDPTEKHFQKITSLNTADSLKAATIQNNVRAGGTSGPSKIAPLVEASTSAGDLSKAATSLSSLNSVYGKVKSGASPNPSATPPLAPAPASLPEGASASFLGDFGGFFEAAAGDVFHALKTVANDVAHVVHIVEETASGIWHFVVTIAGQAYHAVLNTVEAIVGAVEWVLNAIETFIEDIIRFLEFLLEWDDITRTKKVISKISKLFLQGQIAMIPSAKSLLDQQISGLEAMVNQWAGDSDWTTNIGQAMPQPLSANGQNPTSGQTSGSQMLSSHYKQNASNLSVVGTPPPGGVTQELFESLLTALEKEGQSLSTAYSNIENLASKFASISLEDALKQLVAIISDLLLSTVGNIGDALLNVLSSLASTAMDILSTKIYIPVISDILSDLGIPELSVSDLFCWIVAVAYTVVYKITNESAPFPDNSEVNSLIEADSWATLQTLLGQTPPAPVQKLSYDENSKPSFMASSSPLPISDQAKKSLYVSLHGIGGLVQLIKVFVTTLEADGSPNKKENPFSSPKTYLTFFHVACASIADVALPQDPITSDFLNEMKYTETAVRVISVLVMYRYRSVEASQDSPLDPRINGRAIAASIDVILGFWALGISAGHLYELSKETADSNRTAGIMIEVCNILERIQAVLYFKAVTDPDEATKQASILGLGVVGFIDAGLELSLLETV